MRETRLPVTLTVFQLYHLQLQGKCFDPEYYRELKLWMHSRQVHSLGDLIINDLWREPQDLDQRIWSSRQVGREQFVSLFGFIKHAQGGGAIHLEHLPSWEWVTSSDPIKGWELSMKQWRAVSSKGQIKFSLFNRRWNVDWTPRQWNSFFNNLWAG
jgi:hypothetical protein